MSNSYTKTFWDERYRQSAYVYGTAPNVFFAEQIRDLKPGKMLLPFEGEGRNAVWAARLGWEVTCFDLSSAGQEKALKLAEQEGVSIKYQVCDFRDFEWPQQHYDLIMLCYAHLPPDERTLLHSRIMTSLEIGGILLLEAFSTKQLGLPSGGPQNPEMLYTPEMMENDFARLRNRVVSDMTIDINEGVHHQGEAKVIRLAGMR